MATTTSITTTYAGEYANKIIAAALLSSPTIDRGGIEVKPNVRYKQVLKRLATDSILKDATCDFDATSTITLTEKILQPEELQVNLQLCKKDFASDWLAVEQGYSAFKVLPKSFQDFLVAHVASKVAAKNETNIWEGVTANAGEYNGLTTLLALDASLPSGKKLLEQPLLHQTLSQNWVKLLMQFHLLCTQKMICTSMFLNQLPVLIFVLWVVLVHQV